MEVPCRAELEPPPPGDGHRPARAWRLGAVSVGLVASTGAFARAQLTRDLRRAVKRGHPWIYADGLRALPAGTAAGQRALLLDHRGKPLARGWVEPDSPLRFRVTSPDPRVHPDDAWAEAALEAAVALRERLFSGGDVTGFRAVNGEGDGLPGLVLDVYGDAAVLKLDGPGAEAFWDAPGVAAWAAARLGLACVYQRHRARGEASGRPLVGPAPDAPIPFLEGGMRLTADLVSGQKTGFYLDQRENRARVGALAAGRRVLNVFGYTGGFSVAAGLGGALAVTTVDRAPPAIAEAERHWALNGLDAAAHEGVAGDAFEHLEAAAAADRRWDLVVLDPPAFAPSKRTLERALAAYARLAAAGARVTAPGGLLVAASCSAHVGLEAFLEAVADGVGAARRRADVLAVTGQPPDHPAPLACAELRYLKCAFLRLDG